LYRAREQGVNRLVTVGVVRDPTGVHRAVQLARDFDGVYASVGIHPHDASLASETLLQAVEQASRAPEVVAIGETGLDYHYRRSPSDQQRRVFRAQLRLAQRVQKPVVLHLREALADALRILREEGIPPAGGIVHCYSEGPEPLADFLDLGLYVAFSGIVTFPGAEPVRQAARQVPNERLLLETDAPYLAPVPYRGRTNETAHLIHTARALAELRTEPFVHLAHQTTANARRIYDV
jgi:TatD DNase family protein